MFKQGNRAMMKKFRSPYVPPNFVMLLLQSRALKWKARSGLQLGQVAHALRVTAKHFGILK